MAVDSECMALSIDPPMPTFTELCEFIVNDKATATTTNNQPTKQTNPRWKKKLSQNVCVAHY